MSDSVELRDVVKYRGAVPAVDHLSLTVRRGEFFSVLGPSGAGKTTLLRLLAGFERPDGGEILIEGRSMRDVPANLRPVNLVFQSYALFPHLTVFRNIAFGLEMRRLTRSEIEVRVRRILDMVQLAGKQDRFPSQLSGGEQQRVALARALVNNPAVLLLDEPLGALDQQLRQEMQVELKGIQAQVGITFICVTHHQEEALRMSDRVAVLDHGRLLQVGTPPEVYEAPASPFVAGFIGMSNRLTGRIDRVHGTRCTIQSPDLPAVWAPSPRTPVVGGQATVMLRPERLHLSREANGNGSDNAVPARISRSIYNGNETQYLLLLPNGEVWTARVPNTGSDQKPFLPGEGVFVRWNANEGMVWPE